MRTLFLTALLLALPGATRAEGGAPPSPAEKPAKAEKARPAKGSGAKAQAKQPDGKSGGRAQGQPGEAAPARQGEGEARVSPRPEDKPCEPVKPCPIE